MAELLHENYLLRECVCNKLLLLWAAVNPRNVAKPQVYLEMLNCLTHLIFGEISVEDKDFEVMR